MKKKLTLSIDETVIEKAKEYAKGTDRSLSEFIESALQRILNGSTINEPDASYRTEKRKSKNKNGERILPEFLIGIAGVAPVDIDYVKDRDMIREERYSKH